MLPARQAGRAGRAAERSTSRWSRKAGRPAKEKRRLRRRRPGRGSAPLSATATGGARIEVFGVSGGTTTAGGVRQRSRRPERAWPSATWTATARPRSSPRAAQRRDRRRDLRCPGHLLRSFAAYDASFTKGVHLAVGDVTGDGRADIVTGSGNGTTTEVRVFDWLGKQLGARLRRLSRLRRCAVGRGRRRRRRRAGRRVTGASGGPHVRSFGIRLGQVTPLESFFAFDPRRRPDLRRSRRRDRAGRRRRDRGPVPKEGSEVRTSGASATARANPTAGTSTSSRAAARRASAAAPTRSRPASSGRATRSPTSRAT